MARAFVAMALSIVGSFALPAPTLAAEWWYLGTGKTTSFFVDRSSVSTIQIGGKSLVRAWTATFNLRSPTQNQKSSKDQFVFNCDDRSTALKAYINYGFDDSVLSSNTIPDYGMSWNPAAPGTVAEAELAFVCNAAGGEGGITEFSAEGLTFWYFPNLEEAAAKLTPKPVAPEPRKVGPSAVPRKTVPKR